MLCWLGEVAVGTRTPSRSLYCECMFTQLERQHNMQRPFPSSADDRRNRELTACIIVQVSTRLRRRAAVASIRISRVLIGCASAVERRGKVVNTRASYSAGPGFQSRLGNRLSWLKSFAAFRSLSRRMLGWYRKWDHYLFLPHPFQFIIHLSPFHLKLYSLSNLKSVVK
jgi:hypothetical protein